MDPLVGPAGRVYLHMSLRREGFDPRERVNRDRFAELMPEKYKDQIDSLLVFCKLNDIEYRYGIKHYIYKSTPCYYAKYYFIAKDKPNGKNIVVSLEVFYNEDGLVEMKDWDHTKVFSEGTFEAMFKNVQKKLSY